MKKGQRLNSQADSAFATFRELSTSSLKLLSFDLRHWNIDQLLINRVDSDEIYGNILPGSK